MKNTGKPTRIFLFAVSFMATKHAKSPKNGGFAFAADPRLTALDQPVFWTPTADPGAILLHSVSLSSSDHAATEEFVQAHSVDRVDARHSRISVAGERLEISRIDADSAGMLVAILLLDADLPDRLHSVSRFAAMLQRRRVPPDNRLTSQRRRRSRQMLRVFDARAAGATYREIAIALYGLDRIASEPWKTSSLRDAIIGLVEGGFAVIDGGYLELLRRRRRS